MATSERISRAKASAATQPASVQRCACGARRSGGGECDECRKKRDAPVRRAAAGGAEVGDVPPIVGEVLRSPGEPLATGERELFEERLGQDFSRVRVHTGARAAESARAISAHAYTVGSNVVFGAGQFQPGSEEGQRLLAHELTHVAQQRHVAEVPRHLRMGDQEDSAEREAQHVADGVGDMTTAAPVTSHAASIQRDPDEAGRPGNLGPPVSEVPKTACSVIYKKGKWSLKCEGLQGLPDVEIPDPRDIPDLLKDLIPKPSGGSGSAGGTQSFPWPPAPDTSLPPNWFRDLCTRQPKSPLCLIPGPTTTPGTATPSTPGPKPVGVFWTTNVTFDRNVPSPKDPSSGMTADGKRALDVIIFFLNSDPTLQVRLVGHASSEGDATQNLDLSKRRAQLVTQKLREVQLWSRIVDPIQSDGGAAGCTKVEFGVWACGAQQATPGEVRPEERKVAVTFLRNPPLKPGPLKLTPPSLGVSKNTE